MERKLDVVCITTVELIDLRLRGGCKSSLYQAALRGAPCPSKEQGRILVAPLFAIRHKWRVRPRPDLRAPLEELLNLEALDEATPDYCLLAAAIWGSTGDEKVYYQCLLELRFALNT